MTKFLSRGLDYLGDLAAKLRDLQGFGTLIHELIQNADDAVGVSSVTFDVREKGLVVDNDATFSDCNRMMLPECPWKDDPAVQHRCDFHRFRLVAGGDKREQLGTTGAFGIGFIAVYQITDQPELLSAGQHWIIHEERPEDERIEVCAGCGQCVSEGLPATRFILPWATDPNSKLRLALRASASPPEVCDSLLAELDAAGCQALLFLKSVRSLEIRRNGILRRRFERLSEGDSAILTDGNTRNDRIWHLLRGDFSKEAILLRERHHGLVEEKRAATVALAIADSDLKSGLLFACLPTQHETGLPFHINADFFPASDRKRIIFETDYQSEWNRLAIQTAAKILASSLDKLPGLLDHKRFWKLIERLNGIAEEANRGEREETLSRFWKEVGPKLKDTNVCYTSAGKWKKPSEIVILQQREELPISGTLEKIGVSVLHDDLRGQFNLLTSSAVGVPLLNIARLTTALSGQGLSSRVPKGSWPAWLRETSAIKVLWAELSLLLERPGARGEVNLRALKKLAIAVGTDGALWPCEQIFAGDKETRSIFGALDENIPFLAQGLEEVAPLSELCPRFDSRAAVRALKRVDSDKLQQGFGDGSFDPKSLFDWLNDRRAEIIRDPATKLAVSELAIFPSSGRLRRLAEVSLPGDFRDPLGLAALIDIRRLGGRREFVIDLGVSVLDLPQYAKVHLVGALKRDDVPAAKRREAALLLATNIGRIKDQLEICESLVETPIVECTDDAFRTPGSVYFDNAVVKDCLGGSVPTARILAGHHAALTDLFTWLGVAARPRIQDLVQRINTLTVTGPTPESVSGIQKIFGYLAQQFRPEEATADLEKLRSLAWLPARGKIDRWYRASEVYAGFQEYLFVSQALFLNIAQEAQQAGARTRSGWLEWLGIRDTPPNEFVVGHLLHCAEANEPVNNVVYAHLNSNAADAALNLLIGKPCLRLPDGTYVAASQVFWGEHPFGRFRMRLGVELRQYSALLQRLGVRESPDWEDSLKVLNEISAEFGETNSRLDDDANLVVAACWRALEKAFVHGAVEELELAKLGGTKCVVNRDRVLNPPQWMFFEDRAGLVSEFEGFLAGNVIARPIDAGNVMVSAGVRPLASALDVRLTECSDPLEAKDIAERVEERRGELARVLAAQSKDGALGPALTRLERIRFESTRTLEVQYVLHAFNKVVSSKPKHVPALFAGQQETLFFVPHNGQPPWASIAREFAIALYPEEEPGRIAPGLKEVLAAGTAAQAKTALDELGFAMLDLTQTPSVADGGTVSTLGEEQPLAQPVETTGPSAGVQAPKPSDGGVTEAISNILGPDAPTPSPAAPGTGQQEQTSGGRYGTGARNGAGRTGSSTKRPRSKSRLRSYVLPDNGQPKSPGSGEAGERSAIEEAGIQKVLEFERTDVPPRDPRVMPPMHPGYDIESRDASGSVLRYVEVKSIAGDWDSMGVGLSRPQFEKAQELGGLYWLYVVERADRPDSEIHCIQDPAHRVDQFMFDDGWQGAAETMQGLPDAQT